MQVAAADAGRWTFPSPAASRRSPQVVGLAAPPDRARLVAEIARVLYNSADSLRGSTRLLASLQEAQGDAAGGASSSGSARTFDIVPVPLTPAIRVCVARESVGRWPADGRFTKPLAFVNATFGRGREAVRTLQRYLTAHADDREALFLGVEWIYTVHAAGGVVHNQAEDVRPARGYAEAYEKTAGPQAALVKQWMEFLER